MYCDLRCSIRGCALVCFADDPTAKKRDDRCLMTFREGEVLRKMPVRFDQKVAGHRSLVTHGHTSPVRVQELDVRARSATHHASASRGAVLLKVPGVEC